MTVPPAFMDGSTDDVSQVPVTPSRREIINKYRALTWSYRSKVTTGSPFAYARDTALIDGIDATVSTVQVLVAGSRRAKRMMDVPLR